MRMNQQRWETVLSRWSSAPDSGEKRMLVALLAMAICDEAKTDKEDKFSRGYFAPESGFDYHTKLVGVDSSFLREQIERARDFEANAEPEMA